MRVLAFVLRFDRGLLLLAVVASVAAGAAGAGLMGYIGSQFARQDQIGPLEIVAFVALTIFSLAAGLGARWILVRLVGRRLLRLQMELARRLLGTELPTLEDIGSARLLAVMTDDARSISEAMIRIPDLVISTALIAGCFAYLTWLSPLAVGVLFVIALPVILLYRRFHRRFQRLLGRFFAVRDVRYRQYQALTEGSKELQVDGRLRRRFLDDHLEVKGEEFRETQEQVIMANEVANSWSQTAYFVFVFALLVLIRGDYVSGEILGAYALIALYIRSALTQLTAVIPVWTQADQALARVDTLGLVPADDVEPSTTGESSTGDGDGDGDDEDQVRIEVEDLSFRYDGEGDRYDFVLGPVSFELRSGEVVYITGGNGSGKTTLMKVLCALYQPTGGTVRCNGVDVTQPEERDTYREWISVLFADGYLFEELIGLDDSSPEGTDFANQLLAELNLTAKVTVTDGQLSTTRLSTGERRRLALLGAFLKDRPVYAFDEWAANQDPVFKRVFYQTLLPELRRRGKLVLVITHDDAYFDEADRILHLVDGRLVDDHPADESVGSS
ncbi:MAG: cyclic peptide export ABC transporter [Actinomycetota bacterium]